jgi:lipopolysaccharide biosynthesis glycosyltransferase
MEIQDTQSEILPIHLAIAFDVNYLHPFSALLCSILENNKPGQIHIHTIATAISDLEIKALKEYVEKNGACILFYQIDESIVKRFVLTDKWTHAVYYRLLFPLLVNESVERLLYLDCDTIVLKDLNGFYQLDLAQYPVAAVYDNYVKKQALLGITEEGHYFNSGVMLIDVKKWREKKISELAMEYLLAHSERIKFVDQCALNAVLQSNWKRIDSRFNLMYSYVPSALSKQQLAIFLNDIVVVHFTLQRPWNMLCKNRLGFLYFYYLKKSLFGGDAKRYNDFSVTKIPSYLKIRLTNLYFDLPFLSRFWKQTKKSLI